MLTNAGDELKSGDGIADKLLDVARGIAVVTLGILPIFIIPYVTAAPLGYTKILLAAFGVLLPLVLFAFSILRRGSLEIRFELPVIFLWIGFLVALASSLFSGDLFDSFWGTEVGPQSAIFFALMALSATVWMFIGKDKKTIVRLYLLLTGSALVLAVFHLSRIVFGADFLGLGLMGGNLVLSPFSEWNSLAIFFGLVVILSMVALEQLTLRRNGKILFSAAIAASFLMLAIINFIAVFVVLGIVSLVLVIYSLTKGKFKPSAATKAHSSPVALWASMGVLLVSIVFVIGGSTIGSWVSSMTGISYIEVRPSLSATVDIAKRTYGDHLFLGVGTNRFTDAWRMHRDPSINSTVFWNTNFQSGYGYIPTIFVTQGILGGFIWIAFLLSLLYLGFRSLVRAGEVDHVWYFICLSSFVATVYLWGMALIYVPGSVLLLLASASTGIFLASRYHMAPLGNKTFVLMQGERAAFLTVAVTVLVVVATVGTLYAVGRHFGAVYVYQNSFQTGGTPEGIVAGIAQAYELSNDDLFATQVALYERQRIMNLISSGDSSEEAQARFQTFLQQGIEAGNKATALDGTDPDAWTALGGVYAVVVPLGIEGAYGLAREAFVKAEALDPRNPSRMLALAELEILNNNPEGARLEIQRAIALKSNYTDAMYLLAQLEIKEGNIKAAIATTRATTVLDPQNPVRFFQLGVLEFSANNLPDAARAFERAVALNTEYSNARYFLALAYDALDRAEEARTQLKEVLARNPGNQEVEGLLRRLDEGRPLRDTAPASQANETLPEESETSRDGAVTSKKAPDSKLLTPVNTDTVPPQGE